MWILSVVLVIACGGDPGSPAFTGTAGSCSQTPPPAVSPFVAPPDVAAPPADAEKSASGLASRMLTPGTGTRHPTSADTVVVHYTGWTTDGRMFDSSLARKKPSSFPLDRVMPGWAEGLPLMVAGEKRRFWVPEALGFNGQAGRPAGMLVFDIELLEIIEGVELPVTPEDVSRPPADALRTRTGLLSRVIRPGTGTVHPKASSTVTVHYTGWTRNGKMFDSSVLRGQPDSFRLYDVIAGWTEGMQLMVVGEKRRFWIPESLAYRGRPGAPAGMLVFDVELIAIK